MGLGSLINPLKSAKKGTNVGIKAAKASLPGGAASISKAVMGGGGKPVGNTGVMPPAAGAPMGQRRMQGPNPGNMGRKMPMLAEGGKVKGKKK